MTASLQRPLDV